MLGASSSESGTSGMRPPASTARSVRTNATAMTGLAASSTMVHHGQPSERPSVSGIRRDSSERAEQQRAPGVDGGGVVRPRVGHARGGPRCSPTIPTGTFTRKMERHCDPAMSAVISRPPSSWPAALAMPAVAPYRPSARFLASPSVVA